MNGRLVATIAVDALASAGDKAASDSIWVVVKIRIPFWVPQILGAVL